MPVERKGTIKYLKPIGDIGINLVDQTNAVVKYSGSLAGLQRGLLEKQVGNVSWNVRAVEVRVANLPAKLDTPAAKDPLLLIGM